MYPEYPGGYWPPIQQVFKKHFHLLCLIIYVLFELLVRLQISRLLLVQRLPFY